MSGDVLGGAIRMLRGWRKHRQLRADQAQRYRDTCSKHGHVPGFPSSICALCGRDLIHPPGGEGLTIRRDVKPVVLMREGEALYGGDHLKIDRKLLGKLADSAADTPIISGRDSPSDPGPLLGEIKSAHRVGDKLVGLVKMRAADQSLLVPMGFPHFSPSFSMDWRDEFGEPQGPKLVRATVSSNLPKVVDAEGP